MQHSQQLYGSARPTINKGDDRVSQCGVRRAATDNERRAGARADCGAARVSPGPSPRPGGSAAPATAPGSPFPTHVLLAHSLTLINIMSVFTMLYLNNMKQC